MYKRQGVTAGIFLSSLLFGVGHGLQDILSGGLYVTVVMGILFSFIFLSTRNLYGVTWGHIFTNMLNMFLQVNIPSQLWKIAVGYLTLVVLSTVVAPIVYVKYFQSKQKYKWKPLSLKQYFIVMSFLFAIGLTIGCLSG